VNVRVETRANGGWDQPIVIVHPDMKTAREYGIVIADALYRRFQIPVRLTVGDNPVGSPAWGEAGEPGVEVVYQRGG
jgi:hypothetical protein